MTKKKSKKIKIELDKDRLKFALNLIFYSFCTVFVAFIMIKIVQWFLVPLIASLFVFLSIFFALYQGLDNTSKFFGTAIIIFSLWKLILIFIGLLQYIFVNTGYFVQKQIIDRIDEWREIK